MLTLPSLANSPTTLTLPPSVLAAGTSDIVSTRVTQTGLPAPLSDQPTADNAQNNPAVTIVSPQENPVTATANANGTTGSLVSNLSASGPSASFLAQLLSQNDDDENNTVASYAHFAPAPEYNTFVGYSFIKYKPSDAGLPPQRSPFPSPITTYTPPAAPPVEPAPVGNAVASAPQVPAAVVQDTQPPVTFPAPVVSAASVPTNDFQAYSQTQSRNQSNLSAAQPQIIVAG